MKQILENLALIHLNNFGKKNGINISGTHCVKSGRGFKYSLVRTTDGSELLTVTFHKMSTPTYTISNEV